MRERVLEEEKTWKLMLHFYSLMLTSVPADIFLFYFLITDQFI